MTDKPDIYRQHEAAFNSVSAYVVTDAKGERVATITIKYPRDGAGRLFCYLHIFGTPMVRGWAAGGGYDKKTAAACCAARRLTKGGYPENVAIVEAFQKALAHDGGYGWERYLADAGFKVLQAV